MAEIFKQSPPVERAEWRQTYDKWSQRLAPVSAGFGVVGTAAAVAAGSIFGVAVGGALIFQDITQYRERKLAPGKKSRWNTESILDWLKIGTKTSNTRLALAAGAA